MTPSTPRNQQVAEPLSAILDAFLAVSQSVFTNQPLQLPAPKDNREGMEE